jgi:hypothetical protein
MMASKGVHRGVVWAIIGGVVLLAGIAAIMTAAMTAGPESEPQQPAQSPTPTATRDASSTPPAQLFVDPSAVDHGWVPEPITTDEATYVRAALAAASTFDTRKSTREEWLAYLESWFTPDVRYVSDADRMADMAAAKVEFRQGVVLPEREWDSLAKRAGRVTANVSGDVSTMVVPDDPSGHMAIATADVVLTFTQSDGDDGESSFEESVRVSVQVLCGGGSVPAPGTDQRAGDCKAVRYFTEPLES